MSHVGSPLQISGYGVELALKRTDYIVIDDREDESKPVLDQKSAEVGLDDEALADLSPLSSSELLTLGLKASSFVMQSENPFRTLVKLSQDFPKFSAAIATFDTSADFLSEHTSNRGKLVPAGLNVLWLNGMQVMERQIDAFSLLNILRNERELINKVKDIGLTAAESITLLSHDEIMLARANDEVPRYDWTDLEEGGNVIIWLNDIEKDKRYEEWTTTLSIVGHRVP
jgi:UDP-glucose:glycoprotein glucosyltransferase